MRTPDEERVLVCACPSTAKIHALPVPPWIRTCEEAQDWLSSGLDRRIVNSALKRRPGKEHAMNTKSIDSRTAYAEVLHGRGDPQRCA